MGTGFFAQDVVGFSVVGYRPTSAEKSYSNHVIGPRYGEPMTCLACRRLSNDLLCPGCRRELKPGGNRFIRGLVTVSAFSHEGPARALVHRLKYDGISLAADALVDLGLGELIPPDTGALVPLTRVKWRSIKYGIDPAIELAQALSRMSGIPVVNVLRPALLGTRHAGRGRDARRAPTYVVERSLPKHAVLVDDVITTGITMGTAGLLTGGNAIAALTATTKL